MVNNIKVLSILFIISLLLYGIGLVYSQNDIEHTIGGTLFSEEEEFTGLLKAYPVGLLSDKKLPDEIDLSEFLPPVGDQKNQGSCTAWAVGYYYASALQRQEAILNKDPYDKRTWYQNFDHICSPAFVYNSINDGYDGGSTVHDAMNLIMKKGCTPLSIQPYDPYDHTTIIKDGFDPELSEFFQTISFDRVNNFGSISKFDINNIKAHLSEGIFVEGSFKTSRSWQELARDGLLNKDDAETIAKEGTSSGHAMLIIGYSEKKEAFLVQNSWGDDFGIDNGKLWITYEHCREMMREGYIMRDKPSYHPSPVVIEEALIDIELAYKKSGDRLFTKFQKLNYDKDNTGFFKSDKTYNLGDRFILRITPKKSSYSVYVMNISSDKKLKKLTPEGYSTILEKEVSYIYPLQESYNWPVAYEFKYTPGTEYILILLSLKEITEIEIDEIIQNTDIDSLDNIQNVEDIINAMFRNSLRNTGVDIVIDDSAILVYPIQLTVN